MSLRREEVEEALKFYGDPDSYTGHEQTVLAAARAWLEPNYEAAAKAMFDADDAYEAYEWIADVGDWYRRMSRVAVDAAIQETEEIP
jgi:hypothetical protein